MELERLYKLKRKGKIILFTTLIIYTIIFLSSMLKLSQQGYENITQIVILIGVSFFTVICIVVYIALDIWAIVYDIEKGKDDEVDSISDKVYNLNTKPEGDYAYLDCKSNQEDLDKDSKVVGKPEEDNIIERIKPIKKDSNFDIDNELFGERIEVFNYDSIGDEDSDEHYKLSIDDFVESDIESLLKIMASDIKKDGRNEDRDSLP